MSLLTRNDFECGLGSRVQGGGITSLSSAGKGRFPVDVLSPGRGLGGRPQGLPGSKARL